MFFFLPILMIGSFLMPLSIVSEEFKPLPSTTTGPPQTTSPKPNAITPSNTKPTGIKPGDSIACTVAFFPLDDLQTMIFDQLKPEAAAYCQIDKDQAVACALRSCINSTFCPSCSLVTSGPDEAVIKTDGKVNATAQECELAYFINPKPSDGSLCLTGNADVLQCTGVCTKYTSCSTCLQVTETK